MCLHSKFAPGQDTPQWYTDGNDASTTRYGGGAVNVVAPWTTVYGLMVVM